MKFEFDGSELGFHCLFGYGAGKDKTVRLRGSVREIVSLEIESRWMADRFIQVRFQRMGLELCSAVTVGKLTVQHWERRGETIDRSSIRRLRLWKNIDFKGGGYGGKL